MIKNGIKRFASGYSPHHILTCLFNYNIINNINHGIYR
mgnify:CR=1 FL=1